MIFVSINLYTIYIPLLIFALALISYLFISQKKLHRYSEQKLAVIYNDLQTEKSLSKNYKNNDKLILSLESKNQSKLLKIKVDILNIDFTYQEICKFI